MLFVTKELYLYIKADEMYTLKDKLESQHSNFGMKLTRDED